MGGRPPTDDFFLRKLRLSLEDFPDPNEKNHKLLFIILFLLTISCPFVKHYAKWPTFSKKLQKIIKNGQKVAKVTKKINWLV